MLELDAAEDTAEEVTADALEPAVITAYVDEGVVVDLAVDEDPVGSILK